MLIIIAKLSIWDVCEAPGYTSGNSVTWTKCNTIQLQHVKSATREEWKTKTFQSVKLQHEIEQYIKRVQKEKKAIWKNYCTKKCNMVMVQYGKSAT